MEYVTIPIPDMTELRERARNARAYPIDLSSCENEEPARDLRAFGVAGDNYYYRESGNPPYHHRAPDAIPELFVREGILSRLLEANEILSSYGLEVYVYDAYRPVEVQNYFFDHWVPSTLRNAHPEWSDEEIAAETRKYWAKGAPSSAHVDPLSPPPHATGAVVDLTLRQRDTATVLFMGSPFDAVDEMSHVDHFEKLSLQRALTLAETDALRNRRLLFGVMQRVGFVGYPREWWHYGYGDQLSAILSGAPHAVYSKMDIV